ncbi:hypothetical protein [Mycobacterium sp. CnD-18-1]|uniref:hypothetical protein n=1 Tax=Mycobacterium sp. CnD-18-1 TaxID=2917744 RepID=UPI001EF251E5|nr:hypothetical protein [Mycobacterium sp. CnD-18-1]MCG7607112.1 hypothetical protein [Mycobacterium sp. CnD-18-1]
MKRIFDQHIDRANGLIDRALSGRIGYAVSALDTVHRASVLAESASDREQVGEAIARAYTALIKGVK